MTLTRRTFLAAGSAALATSLAPLPALASGVPTVTGRTMGTTWLAVVPAGCRPGDCERIVGGTLARADALFSPYRPESELSRFNARADTTPMTLARPLAHVIDEGVAIARRTGGAFNPALGGIVGRYGFGPIHSEGSTDWADLSVAGLAARKADPTVTFDPCGIAKGYAIDMAADALAAAGYHDILIEVGGEVVTRGRHPEGRAWQLAIEKPADGSGDSLPSAFQHIVSLEDGGLATSGDTINAYTVGTHRYSHIIDPMTLEPVHGVASVSVIAASALEADALATGLMAMGAEAGPAFAADHGIAALFVLRTPKGPREIATPAFRPHIVV